MEENPIDARIGSSSLHWSLAEGVTMRRGVEQVVLMASSNYGTGRRRVT